MKRKWKIGFFGFVSFKEYNLYRWLLSIEVYGFKAPIMSFRFLGLTLNLYDKNSVIEK